MYAGRLSGFGFPSDPDATYTSAGHRGGRETSPGGDSGGGGSARTAEGQTPGNDIAERCFTAHHRTFNSAAVRERILLFSRDRAM
jgi:hypothetical protein